jgi:hypothetical protein
MCCRTSSGPQAEPPTDTMRFELTYVDSCRLSSVLVVRLQPTCDRLDADRILLHYCKTEPGRS